MIDRLIDFFYAGAWPVPFSFSFSFLRLRGCPVMHNRPYLDGGRRGVRSTRGSVPKRTRRHVKDASRGAFVYINTAARSRGERSSKGTGLVAATQTPRVREYKLCMRADGRPDDDDFCDFCPVSTRGVLTSIPHRFIIAGSRDARCTTTCNVALLNVVVNDNGCRVL